MKKYIYIYFLYMEEFEYSKYGCNLLEEKGHEVEVWICAKIFFPKCPVPEDICSNENLIEINTYKEFIERLHSIRNQDIAFIFITPFRSYKACYLGALVKLFGFEYCLTNMQPFLWSYTYNKSVKDIKFDFIGTVLTVLFPPKYNFLATKICYLNLFGKCFIKFKNNILIHTLDYDIYLDSLTVKGNEEEDYILYIDDGGGEHRDYELLGATNPYTDRRKFEQERNDFLDMLEEKYKMNVVIAAHPRVKYKENPFKGRKIVENQTGYLIQHSKLVILPMSLSLDLVVLYKKPFIFIANDYIIKLSPDHLVSYKKALNIKCLNISRVGKDMELDEYISQSTSRECQKFKRMFIKNKNTENRKFFEIVAEKMA